MPLFCRQPDGSIEEQKPPPPSLLLGDFSSIPANISLEELAHGFEVHLDSEENRLRGQSNFSLEQHNTSNSIEITRTGPSTDVKNVERSNRNAVRHHSQELNVKRNYHSPPSLQQGAHGNSPNSTHLNQPQLDNVDNKPVKHSPPDKVEGIFCAYQSEAHLLNVSDTPGSSPPVGTQNYDGIKINEKINPEINSILTLLKSSQVRDVENESQHSEPAEEISASSVNRSEGKPVEASGDEAGDYLKWLEQQVHVAVDLNRADQINNVTDVNSNVNSSQIESSDDILSHNPDKHSALSIEMSNHPPEMRNIQSSEVLRELSDIEGHHRSDSRNESEVESVDSQSKAYSPLKICDKEDVINDYPPTPSPLPAFKHPRDLAMRAQQETPINEFNPLTRIMQPEDNSADIYPRYHA